MMLRRKLTDWTEYTEGALPPPAGALILVRFRDRLESKARRAGLWRWTWEGSNDDIVAYRVLSWD